MLGKNNQYGIKRKICKLIPEYTQKVAFISRAQWPHTRSMGQLPKTHRHLTSEL